MTPPEYLNGLAPQNTNARATVEHECGSRPCDGPLRENSDPGVRYADDDNASAREDAWRAANPADSPLMKFARVWGGKSNSGTEQIGGV